MVTAAIIIGIILLFLVFLTFYISDRKGNDFDSGVTLGMIIAVLLFIEVSIICHISDPQPTAMDVYQGRTTLKITYIDSISTDTVVVFKEEFK